jgi:hypothetical protein
MAENWVHWPDVIQRISTVTGYSIGAAEAVLKGAIAAGHVRTRRIAGVFWGPGRGVVKVDNQWVDVADRMSAVLVSEDDLKFWCRQIVGADGAAKAESSTEATSETASSAAVKLAADRDLPTAAYGAALLKPPMSENKFWKQNRARYGRVECFRVLREIKKKLGIPDYRPGGRLE